MGAFFGSVKCICVCVVVAALLGGSAGRALADDDSKNEQPNRAAAKNSNTNDSTAANKAPENKNTNKIETPAPLSERERMLLDRVEQLERRVEELEAKSMGEKGGDDGAGEAAEVARKEESAGVGNRGETTASGGVVGAPGKI